MKTLFTLIATVLLLKVHAQTPTPAPGNPPPATVQQLYPLMEKYLYAELDEYCDLNKSEKVADHYYKAASEGAFREQMRLLFNTVVTGTKDAVTNGSAFAYSHDKDKHKFSANMAFAGKNWKYSLFDVGTAISSKDNNYNYYADGKWANDISLRIGFNFRFASSQFVMDTTCIRHAQARNMLLMGKLAEIKEAVALGRTSKELADTIKVYIDRQRGALGLNNPYKSYKGKLDTLYRQVRILKQLEAIIDLKDTPAGTERRAKRQGEKLKGLKADTEIETEVSDSIIRNKMEDYVDALITDYDRKNNIFHGYSIWWFNTSASIANSAFKISNDSIMVEALQKTYPARMKASLEASLNYNRVGLEAIQQLKIYTSLNMISYLDSPNLIGRKLFVTPDAVPGTAYYNITDEENNIIQRYENIRDIKYSMDVGATYTNLFMFDKTLGFTGRAVLNYAAFRNVDMLYERNYSLLGGVVFRMASEPKFTAATFTITGGVENQLFHENGWDRFILKASVGVPFAIFEKDKAEKK